MADFVFKIYSGVKNMKILVIEFAASAISWFARFIPEILWLMMADLYFLSNTFLQDGSKLGDNPVVVKAFADLAAQISEDSIVKGDTIPYMSVKEINRQIATLQQPGSAYWDKRNPNHSEAVQEVQELIKKKNNEQDVE